MKYNSNTLHDNILIQASKKRYDKATEEQKKKIDAISNMYKMYNMHNGPGDDDLHIEDVQLRTLTRKRNYPKIGDIFRLMPPNNEYLYGIVINNHVKGTGISEMIVVMIFESKEKLVNACNRTILQDDMFISPKILTKLYWTKGLFETIDRIENYHCNADYGFYRASCDAFVNEYGIEMDHVPTIMGEYSVCTDLEIASAVYREMVYRNMI